MAVKELSAHVGSAGNGGEGDRFAGALELGKSAMGAGFSVAGAPGGSIGEV